MAAFEAGEYSVGLSVLIEQFNEHRIQRMETRSYLSSVTTDHLGWVVAGVTVMLSK